MAIFQEFQFFFYEQAEYINDSHKEAYHNCVDKVDFFFEACQNADDKGKKRNYCIKHLKIFLPVFKLSEP